MGDGSILGIPIAEDRASLTVMVETTATALELQLEHFITSRRMRRARATEGHWNWPKIEKSEAEISRQEARR